jgi:hypothetical protein
VHLRLRFRLTTFSETVASSLKERKKEKQILNLKTCIFVDFPTYLDCWEKNNLFTDGNREKIISSRSFIFVTLGVYG